MFIPQSSNLALTPPLFPLKPQICLSIKQTMTPAYPEAVTSDSIFVTAGKRFLFRNEKIQMAQQLRDLIYSNEFTRLTATNTMITST